MTIFDNLRNKNIEELAEWLDKLAFGNTPWDLWYDENYCKKCEPVTMTREEYRREFGWCSFRDTMNCGYCEANDKCRFFQELETIPHGKQVIKMWLESENKEV